MKPCSQRSATFLVFLNTLALAACGRQTGTTAHIVVPEGYRGPVHVTLMEKAMSNGDADAPVMVTAAGTAILPVRSPTEIGVNIEGVPASSIKDLKTVFNRTGDQFIVGGSIEFTVAP